MWSPSMPDVFHFNFLLDRAMVSVEPHTQKEKHQSGGNDLTLSKNNMQYIEKKVNNMRFHLLLLGKHKHRLCLVKNDDNFY